MRISSLRKFLCRYGILHAWQYFDLVTHYTMHGETVALHHGLDIRKCRYCQCKQEREFRNWYETQPGQYAN